MAELESWLEQHKNEVTLTENNKVHCTLTGHDIPKRLADLKHHWEGRVYRRAAKTTQLAAKARGVDFGKLAPHIIPHKRDPTKCFCKLTQLILNNDEQEVEAHMKGRKFQFCLSAFKPKKKAKAESADDPVWARAPDLEEGHDSEQEDSDPGFPHIVRGIPGSDDEGDLKEGGELEDENESEDRKETAEEEDNDDDDDDNQANGAQSAKSKPKAPPSNPALPLPNPASAGKPHPHPVRNKKRKPSVVEPAAPSQQQQPGLPVKTEKKRS
jgi:hypothetical protein